MMDKKEELLNSKMVLSVMEAVEVSGIGRATILKLIKEDPRFPYIKVGSHYKINREAKVSFKVTSLAGVKNESSNIRKILF